MSDISERVKKIVVEHLGVDEAKVTEEASFVMASRSVERNSPSATTCRSGQPSARAARAMRRHWS